MQTLRLLRRLGGNINVVAPLGASPADIARIPEADFNVVLYPEIARATAAWLERTFQQPYTKVIPIGVGATRDFVNEVATLAGIDVDLEGLERDLRLPWYARSVDSTYLNGKRVFIFGSLPWEMMRSIQKAGRRIPKPETFGVLMSTPQERCVRKREP